MQIYQNTVKESGLHFITHNPKQKEGKDRKTFFLEVLGTKAAAQALWDRCPECLKFQ